MTAQLSRERRDIIEQTANHIISRKATSEHSENLKAVAELALLALAGMSSEPVAVAAEKIVPDGLHPDTAELVIRFATDLAEKLHRAEQKYGHANGWMATGWYNECLQQFWEHIVKGDPRDVAAYCAFMWYHGWKTEAAKPALVAVPTFEEWCQRTNQQPVGWVREAMKESYDGCRAAMLKAGPVTAATVPDGWKLVPLTPTAEMISSAITAHYEGSQSQVHDRPVPGPMECGYMAMLAASPAAPEQEV